MRLPAIEWLRRVLHHVLPKGVVKVRHDAILPNRSGKLERLPGAPPAGTAGDHLRRRALRRGLPASTDPEERLDLKKIGAWVAPQFSRGQGCTTRPTHQHVTVAAIGDVAWFDERLQSSKVGEMRGSCALVKRDRRWRIVQFNFTLPIPNALVS